jgi:hypothetical protein
MMARRWPLACLEGTDVNVLYESGVILMEGAGMWTLFFS